MRPVDIARGFAFRIGAITAGLILVSMAVLGFGIYFLIDDSLEERVGERIELQMARLLALVQPGEVRPLIAEVNRLSQPNVARRFAYRVVDTEGSHIAGDLWLSPRIGWVKQHVPDHVDSAVGSRQLLVNSVTVENRYVFSIGRDIQWISEVEGELLGMLRWALLGGLVLAALTAWITKSLVARRIALVTGSAVTIMDGNLKHRVPVTGAKDDFDRLSQTVNEMLDRIQGLIGNVEQITNDIAHDLRMPLGRLRQGLEQVRSEGTTTQEYEQAIDRAVIEADGLLSTFTAMLRIAQVEAGAQRSAFRKVDLSEVMHSVTEAYELVAEEEDHRLDCALIDGIEMLGDRDLLVQMFANLIENSLAHTPAGSTIRLALERTKDSVTAIVADNGPGIPPEERGKVLQRFYRLETSRTTQGTGLGLSLVAAVAKLHGARLDVGDNHPGLRIVIAFPLDTQPATPDLYCTKPHSY